jgi:hypothetical protein
VVSGWVVVVDPGFADHEDPVSDEDEETSSVSDPSLVPAVVVVVRDVVAPSLAGAPWTAIRAPRPRKATALRAPASARDRAAACRLRRFARAGGWGVGIRASFTVGLLTRRGCEFPRVSRPVLSPACTWPESSL